MKRGVFGQIKLISWNTSISLINQKMSVVNIIARRIRFKVLRQRADEISSLEIRAISRSNRTIRWYSSAFMATSSVPNKKPRVREVAVERFGWKQETYFNWHLLPAWLAGVVTMQASERLLVACSL